MVRLRTSPPLLNSTPRDIAEPGPQHLRYRTDQAHYGADIGRKNSAVDDKIELGPECIRNYAGVSFRLFAGEIGAGGYDRIPQCRDQIAAYPVIRHPDSHGFLARQEQIWNVTRRLENKRICAGKIPFYDLERTVADPGIAGDFRQRRTDDRKRFAAVALFHLVDPLDTFFTEDRTADAIGRIGRVGDHTAILQAFHHP